MIQLLTTQTHIQAELTGSDDSILEELSFSVMRILALLEQNGGISETDSLSRLILSLISLHEKT